MESHDDVSRIQKRYTLTLINPSSRYLSLAFSVVVVAVLTAVATIVYRQGDDTAWRIMLVMPVLLATQYIDSLFIRNKEISKSLHMALFGNSIWLLTAAAGLGAAYILGKPEISYFYIAEGMFLLASFRIGIFTTTLGASLRKAWLVCFLQPVAIFLAITPADMWVPALTDPAALLVGAAFLVITTAWSRWTDRAGMPNVKSTHRLIQAYLFSVSRNDPSEVESIIEEQSSPSRVSTTQIRLNTGGDGRDFRIVLPDIHPGPYHPVGGSNIPYLIYKNLDSSAMVMHSISDHSLNLPSQTEVKNYLSSLSHGAVVGEGARCAEPVTVQVNKARAAGLLFGKTAVLCLSLSPHGMEDIPLHIRNEIEQFSKSRGFDGVLAVDCHNAMGEGLSDADSADLLAASKSALDALRNREAHDLEFGYANSDDMGLDAPDLALGGIGILCLRINGKKFFLGWADANNMENGVREEIVKRFSDSGRELIEICTSDTHYSTGVRNRNGYYQLGIVSKAAEIAGWYLDVAKRAEAGIKPASFEVLEHVVSAKVMGPGIFRDYSRAVDRSMVITKIVMAGCAGLFLLSLL
ncbi:membrane protein [Cenarchaeum symbiosum A]|uniref:Membrane protein n=1 Tax=Cenarchaeum symbiosum (strain A) TaxID=414004 RepID=A0RX67_CENSY|nr:membrane protein [Cenarchaeum symbiosum A]